MEYYTEKPSIPLTVELYKTNVYAYRASSSYESTWDNTKTIMTIDGFKVETYTWVRVNISAGSYWRQVNSVSSCGHSAGGSGFYTLLAGGTFVGNSKFPVVDTLRIDINGIVEISNTNSAEIEFSLLEDLGFSISGSTSTTWYARKSYNTSVTFNVAV